MRRSCFILLKGDTGKSVGCVSRLVSDLAHYKPSRIITRSSADRLFTLRRARSELLLTDHQVSLSRTTGKRGTVRQGLFFSRDSRTDQPDNGKLRPQGVALLPWFSTV